MTTTGRARIGSRPALTAVCLALFLTMLDNTLVSVALPDMQTRLHAGVSGLQWVVTGYILVFASLMLTGGTLGDLFGRRRLIVGGLALFMAASVLAALAPSISVLIVARVLQGAGAAASEPGTLSVLRHIYPDDRERARALGVWAAVGGLALAMGPVIGGVLTDLFTWRGVFWFNVVMGLGAAASVLRWVPESRDRQGRRLDVPGQVLGVVALAGTAFALIQGESSGWTSPLILTLFAVAAAAAVGFWAVERRAVSPVLDLAFFRVARFTGANLAAFAASFGIFAVFFFLSLYVQLIASASPAATAAQFVPMAVAMIGAAPLAGRWAAERGPRTPVVTGLALAGAGMLATDAVLHPGVAVLPLVGALLVLGAGLGTVLAPMTAAVMGSVPPARSGMAAAITNVSRQVGGVVAVALLGAITIAQLTASLTAKLHRLGLSSFSTFIISAVTHGTSPASGTALAKTYGQIVFTVENAAESAFVHGLHVSLAVAAAVLLAAGAVAAATLGPLDRTGEEA